jgi:hypothetical protein
MAPSYEEFLATKADYGSDSGFAPLSLPDSLFPFQRAMVEWSIRKGRAALFADCGMGKTLMQLVWADNVVRHTNRSVLILTPLAVSAQTIDEAAKFGIEAHRGTGKALQATIEVTNYEQLHHYDAGNYAGVVCDESSILKNFDGSRKAEITEFMRQVSYRLLCTATAAPNDWVELGTSSEALGHLGHVDMLSRFFTDKGGIAKVALFRGRFSDQGWRLKPHAEEPFWRWVASWARAARRPSDLGFDDDGFILPPLVTEHTLVTASVPRQGMLFDVAAANFWEEREVTRRTITERCEAAAAKVAQHDVSMVWCQLNDEAATLRKLIPGAVEISGADSDDAKEEAARWFCHGTETRRVLVSKSRIFGYGMNFQHCAHMTYFPTHSYEQYYQATRRLWRFGQTRPVTVDLIYTDGGERMMANLARKSDAADKMFDDLTRYMNQAQYVKTPYNPLPVEVPTWLRSN